MQWSGIHQVGGSSRVDLSSEWIQESGLGSKPLVRWLVSLLHARHVTTMQNLPSQLPKTHLQLRACFHVVRCLVTRQISVQLPKHSGALLKV
ncbi:hypothetical protein ACLKA6_002877 [Drosophila palustris]